MYRKMFCMCRSDLFYPNCKIFLLFFKHFCDIRTWDVGTSFFQVETVGQNEVWIRGRTNQEDYRVGKAYTVRYGYELKYPLICVSGLGSSSSFRPLVDPDPLYDRDLKPRISASSEISVPSYG
jgi:hypothetical protein